MPEAALNLIQGDKIGAETDYRDALPVNMVGISRQILGAQGYMMQAPGITQYAETNGISRRGLWNERFNELYRVNGTEFISVDSDGSVDVLGTVSGTDLSSLPYSFQTQGIVANGNFYLYDAVNGFRQVTDPDLGSPIDAVWVDGYYFFTDGEYLFHTDIANESSINPLKFATAEFSPDPTLGVDKTQDNKVMAFGRYTIEYFTNAASENFAFTRLPTRAIKIGIVATHCKVESGGKHYILGGRKEESISVHAVTVGQSQNVASREVDKIIGQYSETDLSQAYLDTYSEDGQTYILVHLPNETLLFNETLAKTVGVKFAWSILKSDVLGEEQYRGEHFVFDPRRAEWTCGDLLDGRLGILDSTSATQYGDIVEWILYTPFTYLETASIDELEIETIPGFTTTKDATVFVSMTYDGVFWGKEQTTIYGQAGDYGRRFKLRRLGYVDDWFGIKLRGASRSRMAFAKAMITYG